MERKKTASMSVTHSEEKIQCSFYTGARNSQGDDNGDKVPLTNFWFCRIILEQRQQTQDQILKVWQKEKKKIQCKNFEYSNV